MIIFVKGKATSLNNNGKTQFLLGQAHPLLGKFIAKFQSIWKIFIS
jgi:hypothetical protein